MSYSQALEMQIAALRWWQSKDGGDHAAYHEMMVQRVIETSGAVSLAVGEPLAMGDTYYWSPQMCAMLSAVAADIPPMTLRDDLLPSESGYCWFATPIQTPGGDQIVAATWAFRGGALHAYGWRPDNAFSWDGRSTASRNLPHGLPFVYLPWAAGYSNELLLDGTEPGIASSQDGLPARFSMAFARVFAAGLVLLNQRIIVPSNHRPDRASRKRAEGVFHQEPVVRVVELRRRQAKSEHHDEPDVIDWACQWVVSGHWRQQWYPSLNAYQPRWIMPYVKGPEDKPLKPPRAKVFAVVR